MDFREIFLLFIDFIDHIFRYDTRGLEAHQPIHPRGKGQGSQEFLSNIGLHRL